MILLTACRLNLACSDRLRAEEAVSQLGAVAEVVEVEDPETREATSGPGKV